MFELDSRYIQYTPLAQVKVEGKPLGRHIVHDKRSKAPEHHAKRASRIVSVNHEGKGLPLNQLKVGSCTAEALTAAGNSTPNLKGQPRTQDDAYRLYHLETELENAPWPPNDPGGSGLMVCKAGKQLGWVKSYKHAFGLQHALEALVIQPVIVGVNWYDAFDGTDADGIVHLPRGSTVRGGHEIAATEIDIDRKLVGFWQSWGEQYGLKGRFYMPFDVLDQLLRERGDVTVPIFT